jgi:hypothetical protein
MDTQQAFINLFASFYRLGFTEAQSCSTCAEQDLSALSIQKQRSSTSNTNHSLKI